MRTYSDYTRLFPIQKTLRFELKPIGKTKENIERKGILERDISCIANVARII